MEGFSKYGHLLGGEEICSLRDRGISGRGGLKSAAGQRLIFARIQIYVNSFTNTYQVTSNLFGKLQFM